jgi:tRNA (cytidine/uridine-2'-O-)-methyltransferase
VSELLQDYKYSHQLDFAEMLQSSSLNIFQTSTTRFDYPYASAKEAKAKGASHVEWWINARTAFKIKLPNQMFNIVLFEPEIPPNTGNIIRLCANTGAKLHLVKPLSFALEDKQLKRAGLDYHEYANLQIHENWSACKQIFASHRMFAITTKGSANYTETQFKSGDVFVFGPETRGLPEEIRNEFEPTKRLRLPMLPESRSLNLSNSAAVLLYEAWRQIGFEGGI